MRKIVGGKTDQIPLYGEQTVIVRNAGGSAGNGKIKRIFTVN